MAKRTRIAAILLAAIGVLLCWPVWQWGSRAARDFAAPPLSEQRTWAYIPAMMAGALAFWAALAFMLAVGLGRGRRYAWIMALAYATVNTLSSVVFKWWWATPFYLIAIVYLCLKNTRMCYGRKGSIR